MSHGCLTGLAAPFPVSNYQGNLVELLLTCPTTAISSELRLLPYEGPIAGTFGSLYVLPNLTLVVPSLGRLNVNCAGAAPQAVGGGVLSAISDPAFLGEGGSSNTVHVTSVLLVAVVVLALVLGATVWLFGKRAILR